MVDEIINKVANSGLITLNLEDYFPKGKRCFIDIEKWLYEGVMLREKEFRAHVQEHDWSVYQDQHIAIDCTTDAIIPNWAYMLISTAASVYASTIIKGNLDALEVLLFQNSIHSIDISEFKDQRIIIKGCSDLPVPEHAYAALTNRLVPIAKSIMFGEACSAVPIYKRK